jgi:hypothetical protein
MSIELRARWSSIALAVSWCPLIWVSACGGSGGGGGGATGGVTSTSGTGGAAAGNATQPTGGTSTGGSSSATGGKATSTGGESTTTGGAGQTSAGAGGIPTSTGGANSTGGATAKGGSGGASGASTGGAPAGGAAGAAGGKNSGGSSAGGNGGATGGSGGKGTADGCLDFGGPTKSGSIEATALNGPSGMVASRAHAGVLYAQLDAGGTATVYAMTTAGKSLGEYAITGATATDWEDIAVGPGPTAGSFIYIGDIGDNAARTGGTTRTEIQVYRVPEPDVSTTQAAAKESVSGAQALRFTYPDMAHDAETLMVDPVNGDIIIITKETDGNSSIFRAPGNTPADTPTKLEKVGTVKIGASGQAAQASAGDISPTGDRFVVRSYTALLLWPRAATLAETFAATPKSVAWSTEPQGEGITFSADGGTLYLAGEQDRTLYQATANCP